MTDPDALPPLRIRAATAADVERMRTIEIDAGARFREIGLLAIAADDPPEPAVLLAHVRAGTAWVAEVDGEVVGYATASVVDAEAHLDQVSVMGAAAGRGVGRALIDRVLSWGRASGFPTVTLTTFRDVAWNGPYYERLGFVAVHEAGLGPELGAIRTAERVAGIDVAPRQAMRRSCAPLGPPPRRHG